MEKLNELVALAEKADAVASLMDGVNPHTVLAIAEAFRALEHDIAQERIYVRELNVSVHEWKQRALTAEAHLDELAKQEPSEYQYYYHNHGTGAGQWLPVTSKQVFEQMKASYAGDNDFSFRELFTRPAPAVSLAELVPDIRLKKARLWIDLVLMDKPNMKEAKTISEILRNIEDAK